MVIWLRRHKGAITFALTLLLIALTLANAWKYRIVSAEWFTEQKDALSALNSIVTMLILMAGAVFSYYRFFRGRTLSLRTELNVNVSVHQTPEQYRIHAITLTVKNVGSSTIWNPKPLIALHIHGPKGVAERREITDWWEEEASSEHLAPVIDSGETVTFFAQQRIPDGAWAVTYSASLRADQGDVWHVSKTVSNKEG